MGNQGESCLSQPEVLSYRQPRLSTHVDARLWRARSAPPSPRHAHPGVETRGYGRRALVRHQLRIQGALRSELTRNIRSGAPMSGTNNAPETPSFNSPDRYMIPREVEYRLGISPSTRRRWTNRGLLRAYPLGPYYRTGPGDNQGGNRNGSRVRYSERQVNELFERIKKGELARSPKPLDT